MAILLVAGVLPRRKRKRRRKLKKREEDRLISELEAAEKEIRELGFLDLDITDKGYRCPECGNIVLEDSENCPSCGLAFEEGEIEYECPGCGQIIQGDASLCPDCGLELASEGKEKAGEALGEKTIDEAPEELTEVKAFEDMENAKEAGEKIGIGVEVENEESFNCPNCGGIVHASTIVCPECEFKLEKDIEVFNCPKCDHILFADTITCPGCGLNLDE